MKHIKQQLLTLLFLAASLTTFAQVGVGTTTPEGALDVKSTTTGLVVPRVANTAAVVNPQGGAIPNGTLIYDESSNCLKSYENGAWSVCLSDTAPKPPIICTVLISPTVSKDFLCHNLGADTSLDPHLPVVGLNGAYIQWGRRGPNTTGDASVDWQTAANTTNFAAAPTAANDNAAAISGWSQTAATDGAWNSGTEAAPVKTTNDPCPTGYRVPTNTEWTGVNSNNTASRTGLPWSDGSTNYGAALHYGPDASTKLLSLPIAGRRDTTGTLNNRGLTGFYWSSTEVVATTATAHYLIITSSAAGSNGSPYTTGHSLRCIEE